MSDRCRTHLTRSCTICLPIEAAMSADDTLTDVERGDLRSRAAKAEAWDEGYSTCLGDFDIAARRGARSSNPYRADALDAEAGER